MKHSLVIVACAGLFLATSLNSSQAQLPAQLPPPSGPDVPDTIYKGGGDHVPYIPIKPSVNPGIPTITGTRMANGRVHFTFGGGGENTMRYNIRWSRPGKAEVTDMRWTRPWETAPASDHTAQGAEEQYKLQAKLNLEEYIINEFPLWDTVYYFNVQAEGKTKTRQSDGRYDYPLTIFVGKSFRTPPNPSITDRANITENHGALVHPSTTKPSPFSGKIDTTVRLIPTPIIGK